MTECSARRLESKAPDGRLLTAAFDGGPITSDGGVLLLREVEQRSRILERFSECFSDFRDRARVRHSITELASQRVLALALGYEDLVDHDALRGDPLLAAAVGKREGKGEQLASSATLGRIENAAPGLARDDRYRRIALEYEAVDRLLLDLYVEAHEEPPEEVILDLDATDARIHGKQEGRSFHGYYGDYCYLPLYTFAGDHILGARLQRSDADAATSSVEELERIVTGLRAAWPDVRVVVRGDSGFCREWIMSWCEERSVDFVLGIARNERLEAALAPALDEARTRHCKTLKRTRVFDEFRYQTLKSWSRARRVIGKAEHSLRGRNPRFIVTSFATDDWDARALYEDVYCARGEMENRIKEQQLDLFADRVSCHWERGNQTRMYYSAIGYALLEALRRIGLVGTSMARAQCGTIRLQLLKIGARVRCTARRIWIHLSEHHPWRDLFIAAFERLRAA
ncbi:MAG: IS1380 family transposase [Planctomycetota bacterium]